MTLRARKAQMRQPVRLERIAAVVHMLAVVRRDPRARMVVQCAHESSHVAEQAVDRLHRAARPLGHRPCAQRRFSPLSQQAQCSIEHRLAPHFLLRHPHPPVYYNRYITFVIYGMSTAPSRDATNPGNAFLSSS